MVEGVQQGPVLVGTFIPLNGMIAQYLPKMLIGRKRMSVVRATSMLRRISGRKSRV